MVAKRRMTSKPEEEQQEGLLELQARVSELKTALDSSKQELVLKDLQLDPSKGALRGLTTVRQAAQVEQEKANAELLSATNELQRMKADNATLTFQLETTKSKAEERTSAIEQLNSQLDTDTKQLSNLQSKLEKLELESSTALTGLQEICDQAKEELDGYRTENSELSEALREAQAASKRLELQLVTAKAEETRLGKELSDTKAEHRQKIKNNLDHFKKLTDAKAVVDKDLDTALQELENANEKPSLQASQAHELQDQLCTQSNRCNKAESTLSQLSPHNHPRLVINEASFTAGLKRLGDGQADRHSLLGKNKWRLSVSDSASVLITVQGVNPDGVEDIVKFSHHLHRVSVR
ncbi:hypothetical protein QFC24_006625 [Naganishia onofrii]|uniref:Uncharacterized protein n=1 Tax=Naganishia onofrii TaxID=1851511 RepID=A0ACC2X088_9TREE|nr:hypothetical protein QFC24_006625 [Naganishia onofrii]